MQPLKISLANPSLASVSQGHLHFVILGAFVDVCAGDTSKAVPRWTKEEKLRSGFFGTGIF